MKLQHTPTPWRAVHSYLPVPTLNRKGKVIGQHQMETWLISQDGRTDTGKGIAHIPCCFINAETNLDFILRACDANDSLVAALEACIERLEASQPPPGGRTEQAIKQARAALAKLNP